MHYLPRWLHNSGLFHDIRRRAYELSVDRANVREVEIHVLGGDLCWMISLTIRRRRWIISLRCGLSVCWRKPSVGGLKWRWHTAKPEPRRGNGVLFLFFSLICTVLSFCAVFCGCCPCLGSEPLDLRRLLCVAKVRSALPLTRRYFDSRGRSEPSQVSNTIILALVSHSEH